MKKSARLLGKNLVKGQKLPWVFLVTTETLKQLFEGPSAPSGAPRSRVCCTPDTPEYFAPTHQDSQLLGGHDLEQGCTMTWGLLH